MTVHQRSFPIDGGQQHPQVRVGAAGSGEMVVLQSNLQALLDFGDSFFQFTPASHGDPQRIEGVGENLRGVEPLSEFQGLLCPYDRLLVISPAEMETAQLVIEERCLDTFRLFSQEIETVLKMLHGLLSIALSPPVQADLAMNRG